MTSIHIGTSGWHYEHWIGPFYPADIRKEGFLSYYTRYFHTVEINSSFYRLPEKATFEHWRQGVPAGFCFAVKASRFITHIKRLKDPEQAVSTFLERAEALEDKLGPVLFQLPPRWGRDRERLQSFLEKLPQGHCYAFEFRDATWFHPEIYETLARHGAAFCVYELAGVISPKEITAGFAYVRLHGPGGAYSGRYSYEALRDWAGLLGRWSQEGIESYCYFDNDELGYATQNARELQDLVAKIHPASNKA